MAAVAEHGGSDKASLKRGLDEPGTRRQREGRRRTLGNPR